MSDEVPGRQAVPPEPMSWTLAKPIVHGATTYTMVTLRAPTGADVLKASANKMEGGLVVLHRLIAAINAEGVPFEALIQVPSWQTTQMDRYFEAFNAAPMPSPFEDWLAAQQAAPPPP